MELKPTTFREALSATERQELLAELLELHARVLLRMPFFQLALIAAIGWMVLPDVPLLQFAEWAAMALVAELMRAASAHWLLARLPGAATTRVYRGLVALDALAGLTLGIAALWFVPMIPLLTRVLLETTLFTVAAAGTAVTVSSALMFSAYSSTILIGASTSWILRVPQQAWIVGLLTLVCWAFLLMVARDSERLLLRALRIRHERDRALASLAETEAELRAAYVRIERGVQARNRVMLAASHDLRQPLQALSVYSAVLAMKPEQDVAQAVGHNIEQLACDLGHILDELLDWSALESGAYRITQAANELDPLLRDVCAGFEAAARRKGLAFEMAIEPATCVIDRTAFTRIARNLIDNAIKFTDQGHVRVALREHAGSVMMHVEDTGYGIPDNERNNIFEEFYRIDRDSQGTQPGFGLGLAIVHKLCALTSARLDLWSASGKGSHFKVEWKARPNLVRENNL